MEAHDIATAFASVVRSRRERLGYSQEAFADLIGVHRTFMGGIERAKHVVTIFTAYRVATGLGVSLSDLMAEVERFLEA